MHSLLPAQLHAAISPIVDGAFLVYGADGRPMEAYGRERLEEARRQLGRYGDYSLWPERAVIEADLQVRMTLAAMAIRTTAWGAYPVAGIVQVQVGDAIRECLEAVEDQYGLPGCHAIAQADTDLRSLISSIAAPNPWCEEQDSPYGPVRVCGLDIDCDEVVIDLTEHPYCPDCHGHPCWRTKGVWFTARPEIEQVRARRRGTFHVQVG